jgi:hypothetical protein
MSTKWIKPLYKDIIFIRVGLVESLFIKSSNTLRVDFLSTVSKSAQNLAHKILTDGYKYIVNNNLILTKSLQTPKKYFYTLLKHKNSALNFLRTFI